MKKIIKVKSSVTCLDIKFIFTYDLQGRSKNYLERKSLVLLEKSVFNNNEIKKVVKKYYNINIEKIEHEDRGSSNIFYVYDLNNKYVLKEFESRCKEEKILQESKIIEHLKNKNIKVPKYIKTVEGGFFFKYKGRIIILMEFIEGYTKSPNTGSFKQTIESATLLGKITKGLEDYGKMEKISIKKYYKKEKIEPSRIKYLSLLSKLGTSNIDEIIKKDFKYKLQLLDKIEKMDFEGMKNMTYKNSHGDFSIMQFIYKDEKVNAVLDFERARCLPIAWEIIRSYTHIDEKCKNGDFDISNFIEYVKEVMKYIELNKYDLKFMPYMYLLRLATSPYGYEEYMNNNKLKSLLDFGIWRTKMCKSLIENMDEITDNLMSI